MAPSSFRSYFGTNIVVLNKANLSYNLPKHCPVVDSVTKVLYHNQDNLKQHWSFDSSKKSVDSLARRHSIATATDIVQYCEEDESLYSCSVEMELEEAE